MATLSELHELVHALKKNEKKHINLMIQALGSKARDRYLHAFKAINTCTVFDETKLKSDLSKGFSGMNLSEANNNIYGFIGDAILSYKNSGINEYTRQLALIEFYIQRKLYARSHKLLKKLIPVLKEKGSYATLQRAEELQEKITIYYPEVNADLDFRKQFFHDRKETIEYAKFNLELLEQKFEFFQIAKTIGTPRNQKELEPYLKIWAKDIMHIPFQKIPNRSCFSFYQLKGALQSLISTESAEQDIQDQLRDYQSRFEGNSSSYRGEFDLLDLQLSVMSSANNINLEQIIKVEHRINELLIDLKNPNLISRGKAKLHILKLLYHVKTKHYEDGINCYHEAMKEQTEWDNAPLSYLIILLGANIQFNLGQTETCLDSLELILEKTKGMTPTYLINFHFLRLISHYQLGNHQYLESATRSLYRHLSKAEKFHTPEKAILSFLKHGNDINKMERNFEKLFDTFKELEFNKYHRIFFAHGNYIELLTKVRGVTK